MSNVQSERFWSTQAQMKVWCLYQSLCRRDENILRVRGDLKERVPSDTQDSCTYDLTETVAAQDLTGANMNSQRLWRQQHRSWQIPAWRCGSRHKVPSVIQMLFPTVICWEGESQSSMESLWLLTTLQEHPMPRSGWPTQNRHHVLFVWFYYILLLFPFFP